MTTESIKAFLERMKEVGDAATKEQELSYCTAKCMWDAPAGMHKIDKLTAVQLAHDYIRLYERDKTARNNWDRLIRMNEILLAACEAIGDVSRESSREERVAAVAIKQAEELVK